MSSRTCSAMQVLDPGHQYRLLSLDGSLEQDLTFVKRCDAARPERFPGNTDAHPGTTMQSVLRALLERLRYLQGQIWSIENGVIIALLRVSLWLLEFRAARRHGRFYPRSLDYAEQAPLCPLCGHTICEHAS